MISGSAGLACKISQDRQNVDVAVACRSGEGLVFTRLVEVNPGKEAAKSRPCVLDCNIEPILQDPLVFSAVLNPGCLDRRDPSIGAHSDVCCKCLHYRNMLIAGGARGGEHSDEL